ncbi:hypothetical protein NDU88_001447 [Pleurodeles waltl]|uniref:Uncharacterized protein n=1 Tax=Pleurodeles waltl TaxID=8319 RepID=A0AAV7VAD1_PLEWA|nr:hypothetical protein NDU88_001447 [Pleurodeles waltl]
MRREAGVPSDRAQRDAKDCGHKIEIRTDGLLIMEEAAEACLASGRTPILKKRGAGGGPLGSEVSPAGHDVKHESVAARLDRGPRRGESSNAESPVLDLSVLNLTPDDGGTTQRVRAIYAAVARGTAEPPEAERAARTSV